MKKFSLFLVMLCGAVIIYGQECLNLQIKHICAENQTVISAGDGVIAFNATGRWSQGTIDYQIKQGLNILSMSVRANEEALLVNIIFCFGSPDTCF